MVNIIVVEVMLHKKGLLFEKTAALLFI